MPETELARLTAGLSTDLPASARDLEAAGKRLGIAWPGDYLDFMITRNGGEGVVGKSYVDLWRAEDLIDRNLGYNIPTLAPQYVAIGSYLGDEAFVYDRTAVPPVIVMVPFIGWDDPIATGTTFLDFLRWLYEGRPHE